MLAKHWHLRVGHAVVHIESDVEPCINVLDAMLNLYQQADIADDARAYFKIISIEDKITLLIDDEMEWQGFSAEETVAGFEIHFYTKILQFVEPKLISVHSACVSLGNQAVMLAGISGAGKSSSCTAALLDGATYLTDEFSLLSDRGGVVPFPRPLQWGKQNHPAFSHAQMLSYGFGKFGFRFPDFEQKQRYTLFWLPQDVAQEEKPLKAIVFPRYDKSVNGSEVNPMLRSQALMELSTHLHHQYSPLKSIQELNQRVPQGTQFLKVNFSDVFQSWQSIKQALRLA